MPLLLKPRSQIQFYPNFSARWKPTNHHRTLVTGESFPPPSLPLAVALGIPSEFSRLLQGETSFNCRREVTHCNPQLSLQRIPPYGLQRCRIPRNWQDHSRTIRFHLLGWHSQGCRVPLQSLCHLLEGEGFSKTTNFPTTNSDQQTMGNGGQGHPQSPHVK